MSLTQLVRTMYNICKVRGLNPGHRDVRGAVWFGFEHKSHPNREIKKHAVWFGSVDF